MARDPVRLSVAFYRTLLFIYPSSHRREYGQLMLQLFGDLCREAYQQQRISSLVRFWMRIPFDLVWSAYAAHLEAIGEVIMAVNPTIKPMAWSKVLLVVVPGLLLAYSRIYYPLFVVGALALAWLFIQKRLPAWGLLGLGLLTSWVLLQVITLVHTELGTRTRLEYSMREMLVSIPVWILMLLLVWKFKPGRRIPAWVWMSFILVVAGFTAFLGTSVLSMLGFLLLPVALGLPLSRWHGSLASLFVVGAYSLWLFDTDYYSVPLMKDMAFYPIYVLVLWLFYISLAPLLLLRARSRAGRAVGLLAPVVLAFLLVVAVPWLVDPGFHPLRIWLGNTGLFFFMLLVLALGFYLYQDKEAGANSGAPLPPGTYALPGIQEKSDPGMPGAPYLS